MMTLAVLSRASKPDNVAKPSSGSFGRGGRPKSRIVTAGRRELNVSRASGAISSQQDFVVLTEGPLHLCADFLVVINDEQFRFHGRLERVDGGGLMIDDTLGSS